MTDSRAVKCFWDMNQYRKTVKRIENGHKSCEEFMTMVQERADLEMKYSKSLKSWAEKWEEKIVKGPEYGSSALSWKQTLQEALEIAKIHEECRLKLLSQEGPQQNMQKWKKENYHKLTFGGFQEIRDAEEGFAAAQKDYAKVLGKTKKAKKDYHIACNAAFKAEEEKEGQTSIQSAEANRKLIQRVEKQVNEREKCKQVYQKRLLECHGDQKQKYIANMTMQFEKCQAFEKKRLNNLKDQLTLTLQCVDLSAVSHFPSIYKQTLSDINEADAGKDLDEWRMRYGTGMEPEWPKFEEFDISTDSRRFSFAYRKSISGRDDGLFDDDFDSDEFGEESDETDAFNGPKHVNGHSPGVDSHSLYDNVVSYEHIGEPSSSSQDQASTSDDLKLTAVRALYDFEPASEDELQLRAGDILTQIGQVHDNGWAYGRLRDKLGLFPANYVESLR
ncbi:protein kinase C and casein kinase substrate in neurons protein 1-like [Glandiceps talaboti]